MTIIKQYMIYNNITLMGSFSAQWVHTMSILNHSWQQTAVALLFVNWNFKHVGPLPSHSCTCLWQLMGTTPGVTSSLGCGQCRYIPDSFKPTDNFLCDSVSMYPSNGLTGHVCCCISGYSLLAVAAHELGHSLGLTHSRDPSAIMYPNYRSHSSTQYSLSKDDVLGIQTLYGEGKKKIAQNENKIIVDYNV